MKRQGGNLKSILLSKRSQRAKACILYTIPALRYSGMGKTMETKDSWSPGVREERGVDRHNKEDFLGW